MEQTSRALFAPLQFRARFAPFEHGWTRHLLEQSLRRRRTARYVDIFQLHREFITAQSRHRVSGANHLFKAARVLLQQFVAGRVAQRVVTACETRSEHSTRFASPVIGS